LSRLILFVNVMRRCISLHLSTSPKRMLRNNIDVIDYAGDSEMYA